MDLPQYLQRLSFRFVQPEQRCSLASRSAVAVLHALGLPLDAFNTRLPFDRAGMRRKLRGTKFGSSATPLAVRALVNRGVAHLEDHEAFVAFGLSGGEALLAAIAGNPQKLCIGIMDCDALRIRSPERTLPVFSRRFGKHSNDERHFIENSFPSCVQRLDGRPIGFCLVSAASHEPIASRLIECEPHLAENAYLLVDNGNCDRTRQAVFDFMTASRNQFRVLWDARTANAGPLTVGRGLLAIQLLGRNAARRSDFERPGKPVLVPAAA
jgi:hypothetical protein